MLHAKFQEKNNLTVFTIYGRGGHLGHVTNFHFAVQWLHIEFGLYWPESFGEEGL